MCSLFFTFLEINECKYFNELSALTSLSGYTSLEYYVRSAGLVVRISSGGERNMGDFVLKWGERPSTLEDTMSDSLVTLITQNSFFTCKGAKNELLFFIENLRNIHQLSLISNIHLKNLIFRHQKTPLNHLRLKSVHSPSLERSVPYSHALRINKICTEIKKETKRASEKAFIKRWHHPPG